MRMFAPILAGSMKLSFRRFLLFDSTALAAFTTIYLLIGIIFNKSLGAVISRTKWLQDILFSQPSRYCPFCWLYGSGKEKGEKGVSVALITREIFG